MSIHKHTVFQTFAETKVLNWKGWALSLRVTVFRSVVRLLKLSKCGFGPGCHKRTYSYRGCATQLELRK